MKPFTVPQLGDHPTSSFRTMKYSATAFLIDHVKAVRREEIITPPRWTDVLTGEFADESVNKTRLRKP
jgi:hypothetical protein